MQLDEQEITFRLINSGDKTLDAAYFIKMMFERYELTDTEKIKVLEFVKPVPTPHS